MKMLTVLTETAASNKVKELEDMLLKASHAYYNSGKPIMTDAQFDRLQEQLRLMAPGSPVLQGIGAPVTRAKVKLPFHMGSMDKIKADTADIWLQSNRGPYVAMDKLDGYSIGIVYQPNGDFKVYSRGDGTYGRDITNLVAAVVPKHKGKLEVRAELIMPPSLFNKWKSEFSNPRNMMGTVANGKKPHLAIKDTHIVAYERIDKRAPISRMLAELKALGFKTPGHKRFTTLDANQLSSLLKARKSASRYEIDGLIVALDNKAYPANTNGNPTWAKAFKENEASKPATVVRVEWEASRTGLLKPRVIIKPMMVGGVMVSAATGHNAQYIVSNKIGPGALISIVRSGDVIPYITDVLKGTQAQLPTYPKSSYGWDSTRVNFRLHDPTRDDVVLAKKIVHFFKTLGTDNLSIGIVSKLIAYDLDSITKITRAKESDFLMVPGFGETLAKKIYSTIQTKIRNVPLHLLMAAYGGFGPVAGSKLKDITDNYPNILTLYAKQKPEQITNLILSLRGFSQVSADAFVAGMKPFMAFVKANPQITYRAATPQLVSSQRLKGVTIVMTGVRNAEWERLIKENGGNVANSVTDATSILVMKDKTSATTKAQKARQLGISIMGIPEFESWLKRRV